MSACLLYLYMILSQGFIQFCSRDRFLVIVTFSS